MRIMKKIIKVFKKQFAFDLKDKYNINWIDTEPNYNNSKLRVFLFEENQNFNEAFSKINKEFIKK